VKDSVTCTEQCSGCTDEAIEHYSSCYWFRCARVVNETYDAETETSESRDETEKSERQDRDTGVTYRDETETRPRSRSDKTETLE